MRMQRRTLQRTSVSGVSSLRAPALATASGSSLGSSWSLSVLKGGDSGRRLQRDTMKITRILAYRVDLPLHEGSYKWSGGKSVSVFDSTVVAVETDAGITGYGEVCPLGPAYLAAYAAGARTGIAELAPHLIGL